MCSSDLRRLTVSWSTPANNGGAAITGYKVEICPESSANVCNNDAYFSTVASNTGLVNSYVITGLTNGTLYAVRVSSVNDIGVGSFTYVNYRYLLGRPSSTPIAPNQIYTTSGSRYIDLNWSGATANGYPILGYKVELTSDNGVTWSTVSANTFSSATSLRVNGLTNGVQYGFRVSAVSYAGVGAPSGVYYGTPRQTTSGGVPNLRATVGDSQVTLNWSSPSDTAGVPIVGYRITYLTGGSTVVVTENTLSLVTNYTVYGLTNGTSYTFNVFPITSNGYSNAGSVVARPQVLSQAPREFKAQSRDRQVYLQWLAPAFTGANADQRLFYRVEFSEDGATWTRLAQVSPTATSYLVAGLTNGTNYRFRLSLVTTVGQGATTTTASTPYGPPTAVRNLSAISGDRSVSVSWDPPSDLGGGQLTGYRVLIYCAGGNDSGAALPCAPFTGSTWHVLAANLAPSQNSYNINGLRNGNSYAIIVQPMTGTTESLVGWVACDDYLRDGQGTPLSTNTARCAPYARVFWVAPSGSPSAPKSLTITTATSSSTTRASVSATLSWTAPDWTGGDYINGYRIEQSTDGATWTTLTQNTGWRTLTTYTVNGLIPGTRNFFRVAAVGFTGAVGEYVTTSTSTLAGADAPSNLSLSRIGNSNSMLASWTAPAFTGGTPIIGYRIERFFGTAWFVVTPNTGNTNTTYTLDGYDAGSSMQIRVSAVTAAGIGESALQIAQVGGTGLGGARFTTTVGNGFVDLAWAVSAAFVPGSYRLEYRVVGSSTWTVVTSDMGAATAFRVGGLTNGVNYEVRLTPIYVVGGVASFGSPASVFATPMGSAGAPTSLTATTGNASTTLSWIAPTDLAGGSIIGYRIEQSSTSATTGFSVLTPNTGSSGTTFNVNGLSNGTQYWFRISAITDIAQGTAGNSAVTSVTPVLPGRAVAWLSAAPGNTTAVLTWDKPQFDDEATDYIGYRIERSTDGLAFTTIAANIGKVFTYTATGLTNGTSYWFRVVTLGQQSDGGSSVVSVVPARYSSRLASLTATISDRQVTLNWTRPTDTGGWPLLGYMISRCWSGGVYCDPTNSAYWTYYLNNGYLRSNDLYSTIAFVGPEVTSFTFNVDSADAYRVIPVTALGVWSGVGGSSTSWFPNASAIQATWWGVPSAVNALKATVNSPGGVGAANTMLYFDWTAPTNVGNGVVSGYDVEQSYDGGLTWSVLGRTRQTYQFVSGVPAGVSIMLRVRAANEYGVGPWSSVTSSWTATPTTPRNPSVTTVGNRVTFAWDAPELTSGMGVLGYAVEVNFGGAWSAFSGTGVGFTATSLQWSAPNNTYYNNLQWRVRALTTAPSSNGSLTSEWAYAGAPLLGTSAPVASPRAVAGNTTTTLSWSAPTDLGGGTITSYRVEQNLFGSLWFPVATTTTTTLDVRGLLNGSTYRFRITPVTTQGDGQSSIVSAMPFGPASAPSLVRSTTGDGFKIGRAHV